MDFPQYRKLSNDKAYYKISSLDLFIELQQVGSTYFKYEFKAAQYPEKLKILDMLQLNGYLESTEEEFNEKLRLINH